MTDRARIAENLAKALGLAGPTLNAWHPAEMLRMDIQSGAGLWVDGSNVFDDPWFRLALEWLLAHHFDVELYAPSIPHMATGFRPYRAIEIGCDAVEFPARAIDQLMEGKE